MRDQQPQQDMRESDEETGRYEAQAGSSAPAAPVRERQSDVQRDEAVQRDNAVERDEAAERDETESTNQSTTENQMRRESDASPDGSGLLQDQRWQYFAGRWDSIQSGFVDDPRRTVEQADRLVAEVIDHLSKIFRDERAKLESQWSRGGKADTEDLRIAMQRYRDFFRTLVGR
ncbi:MAG TPA: hypothetical protein VIT43_02990 [Candidatus Dormibacteraeota bacterium]